MSDLSAKELAEVDQVASEAYQMAESILKTAVEASKSESDFVHNLRVVQVLGQRLLGLLIFNTHVSQKVSKSEQLKKIMGAIEFEIKDLEEAHKLGKMNAVDIDLKVDKANVQ